MDGSVHIKCNGTPIKYKEIIKRPVKQIEKIIKIKKVYSPPLDHPWRKSFKKYFQPKLRTVDEK